MISIGGRTSSTSSVTIRRGIVARLRYYIFVCSFWIVLLLVVLLIIPDASTTIGGGVVEIHDDLYQTNETIGNRTGGGKQDIVFTDFSALSGQLRRRMQPRLVKLQTVLQNKRNQVQSALKTLTEGNIPARLRILRERHEIVGERLSEIRTGIKTVHEIIHGHDYTTDHDTVIDKPPMTLSEIISFLNNYIRQLHSVFSTAKYAPFDGIWQIYHDLTIKTLYPWDRDYLSRMPVRRNDGSIFVSMASYRDGFCHKTMYEAYSKSKHPDKLYFGLVQQNCYGNCRARVLETVQPDTDCYQSFCSTEIGAPLCANNHVRVLNMDESDSIGQYSARYFASKLWYGEQWFMQIDAHMKFAQDWDEITIEMLQKVPTSKPVLSHYPPASSFDLDEKLDEPTTRLCGPVFATSDLEDQIIRLEGSGIYDKDQLQVPAFAPFAVAGYFVAHSDFLRDVPYDPFLPWTSLGEDIVMSSRLWTAGYDIYSPNQAVVGYSDITHQQPRFWESVQRAFVTPGIQDSVQGFVLLRIKFLLGYPEAARDMLFTKSILTAVEQYGMGTIRPLEEYLRIIGTNLRTKEITYTEWCEKGYPPPGFDRYDYLYPGSKSKTLFREGSKHGINRSFIIDT